MSGGYGTGREPMLDMFVFETNQLLEQLEEILLHAEREDALTGGNINEIFRIMHTIKGSAAMMMFTPLSSLAHAVEDLFFHIRENKEAPVNFKMVCDLVLRAEDAIKGQMQYVEAGEPVPDEGETPLQRELRSFLGEMREAAGGGKPQEKQADAQPKQFYISQYGAKADQEGLRIYHAHVSFDEGCEMENIRAYSLVFNLQAHCAELHHHPDDLTGDDTATEQIVQNGFHMWFSSHTPMESLNDTIHEALFVREGTIEQIDAFPESFLQTASSPEAYALRKPVIVLPDTATAMDSYEMEPVAEYASGEGSLRRELSTRMTKSSLISVNIEKLDRLMDLVGEIVITESMVTRCPELADMQLDMFYKSANQLRKLTDSLQDIVMSIRMLPIANTFQKMNRIVRDMGKTLGKEAELVIVGEETEVDKNLIDQLADPLMHLVRNAMDHGLENTEERKKAGKHLKGSITLEARNDGGEIWIEVRDDGRGLNRERILEKAKEHGLTSKPDEELSDKEVFGFVMLPGFSTKEKVSEFSGRGVGMDVVRENITRMGGSISIESTWGQGSSIIIRIPLTLAIIDGMLVSVGENSYIIPTMAIRESLRVNTKQAIRDSEGSELLMIRGECFPLVRLNRRFAVESRAHELEEGIVIVIEHDRTSVCLFADELLGEQHVVVKPLPAYFRQIPGISGCTILGDGSISLILDVGGLDE